MSEVAEIEKTINDANSPAQLHAVAQSARHLLQSKKNSLQGQYTQGMRGQPNFNGQNESATPAAPASHPFFSQFGGTVKQQ